MPSGGSFDTGERAPTEAPGNPKTYVATVRDALRRAQPYRSGSGPLWMARSNVTYVRHCRPLLHPILDSGIGKVDWVGAAASPVP